LGGFKIKKNIACIIARTNSTRLEKKVLRPINGKLAIEFLIDRMKLSKKIDKIVLCTSYHDNDKILLNVAEKNNIYGFAGDPSSVISRMLNVGKNEESPNLIRITGDNFLTDPTYLDIMIDKHETSNSDYTRIEYLPIGITSEIMSFDMLSDCYNNMDPKYSEYLMLYAFNPIKYNCTVLVPPKEHQLFNFFLTVDTPEDFKLTKNIINCFDNYRFNFDDVVKILKLKKSKSVSDNKQVKFPGNIELFYSTYRNEIEYRVSKSNQIIVKQDEYLSYAKNK